jgi:hypothetical protein
MVTIMKQQVKPEDYAAGTLINSWSVTLLSINATATDSRD